MTEFDQEAVETMIGCALVGLGRAAEAREPLDSAFDRTRRECGPWSRETAEAAALAAVARNAAGDHAAAGKAARYVLLVPTTHNDLIRLARLELALSETADAEADPEMIRLHLWLAEQGGAETLPAHYDPSFAARLAAAQAQFADAGPQD